ncbi:MAG: tyrosine-protein kinase family protein [Methanobacteriota archaeon]|nr:MAG: tyrosine-protein kinase family protein [Euryarchaeota archaeon]
MEIILSHSFKGGSGKTTISVNFAKLLASKGKVLLLEADFKMPSLHHMFPEIETEVFFNDYLNGTHTLTEVTNSIERDGQRFDIVFVNKKFIPSEKIHSSDRSWFLNMRDSLFADLKRNEYNYVIFDLAPGISFFTLTILTISDIVLSVVRPDFQSVKGMEMLLENFYKRAISSLAVQFHLIFNQVPNHPKMQDLIADWIMAMKIKYPQISSFSNIEYDTEVAYRSAIQEIFLPDDSNAMKKLKEIASIL